MVTSITVTGATGFLGKHVLDRLAELSVNVIAVSRRTAGQPEGDKLRWAEVDIADPPNNIFAALGRPDVLLHLAWGGLPDYRARNHLERQLPAQLAFLRKAVEGGLRSLVVAGTCLEYGMQPGELGESFRCNPDLPYAVAKHALLRELLALKADHPFSLTWARLFYMYGPGQQEKSLWSQFMAAYRRGEREFDMSGGEQLRDFLPVDKVAEHLAALALAVGDFGVVNVCSGEPVSILALVESWAEALGWDVQLNLGRYPYPDYEPMEFWGDNARLKEALATA